MMLSEKVSLHFIDCLTRLDGKACSTRLLCRYFGYVSRVFEKEAMECYYKDMQDIGFFETFLLGSDETKKMSSETHETMESLRLAQLKEKLYGFVSSESRNREEAEEVVRKNIMSKKQKVVELLQKKGEIIKYLGRRIVTQDEKLYLFLERLYNRIEQELKSRSQNEGSRNK